MRLNRAAALALVGCYLMVASGCASQTHVQGVSDAQTEQAKVDADAEKQIYWNEHRLQTLLIYSPLIPVALLASPFLPTPDKCEYDAAGHTVIYHPEKPLPTRCKEFAEQQRALAVKRGKEADVQAARERVEAERKRKEAVEALLRDSPVQSQQGLQHDIELVDKLTPAQQAALRDAANRVILTADEQKALASIDLDQWHAITQLAAFFKWLNDKIQEAQAQAEKQRAQAEEQQEQVQREEDRVSLAIYQSLMTEAVARQAAAAQWQAAAAWRQQQCLSDMSRGLRCY